MVSFNYCILAFTRDIVYDQRSFKEGFEEKVGWGICFQICKMTQELPSQF